MSGMPAGRPSLRALFHQLHHVVALPLACPVSISNISGEEWVGLGGGDAESIPEDTAFVHHGCLPVANTEVPESMRGPVWSNEGQAFLAYGVSLESSRTGEAESWVHSYFLDEREFLDPTAPDQILPELASKIIKDLNVANSVLDTLDHRGGLSREQVNRSYDGIALRSSRGVEGVRKELRRARRIMDERCAAINLGVLRSEDGTRSYIKYTFAAYVTKWKLLGEMRGMYIDFRDCDAQNIHVLEMLQHRVPVFYPVDPKYRPHFPAEETRVAEQVKTQREYMHWLTLAASYPDVVKSRPPPLIFRGLSAPELVRNRIDRLEALAKHARFVLADTLNLDEELSVNPLGSVSIRIMGAARLLVDPPSEVRMMVWSAVYRASNACEALGEALLRGWRFQVAYPADHLDELSRKKAYASSAACNSFSSLIILGESDYLDARLEWRRYLARVGLLLSRPHAKNFLLLGGIYWRLVILFGADHLATWMEDILAPSVGLVQRREGREALPGYWCDEVTEAEKRVLLGLVYGKRSLNAYTWFPPQDLLDKYGLCHGEWSLDAERFIMDRYAGLQGEEHLYRPLTVGDWEVEILSYKTGQLTRDSLVIPDPLQVDTLLLEARTELGGSWNKVQLMHITTTRSASIAS